MKRLRDWIKRKVCERKSYQVAWVIVLLAIFSVVAVVEGVVGLIGISKLYTANTNLWEARQQIASAEEQRILQAANDAQIIEELRMELTALKDAKALEREWAAAEAETPTTVWRFTGTGNLSLSFKTDDDGRGPRIRPSPRAGTVAYGRISSWATLRLDWFYTSPLKPQEGIGVWLGIPVHLLSESELYYFAEDVLNDADGIIWISWDYIVASDYMRNYPAEQVNLPPAANP